MGPKKKKKTTERSCEIQTKPMIGLSGAKNAQRYSICMAASGHNGNPTCSLGLLSVGAFSRPQMVGSPQSQPSAQSPGPGPCQRKKGNYFYFFTKVSKGVNFLIHKKIL